MTVLAIEEINNIEKFHSLRETWNMLLRQSSDNNIFLTWEWLFTWWQHYGKDKKLRILIIKESDKIIGIAPLMQSKYRVGFISVDMIENLCSERCDYSGIILTERKQESVAILLDYLEKIIKDSNIIVRMLNVPENSSFLTVLREQYPAFSRSMYLDEQLVDSCPYIDLPASWEEYFHTLSKHMRENLRRRMRSMQKDHVIEFKKYENGDDLREQLQVLFELHQKRWRLKNMKSKFAEPEAREFYFDVSQAFHKNKWLDLSFQNVDGKPVSAHWGFIYNNIFHYMTPAFDPDYSYYSVGNLHIMKLLEDSIKNRLRKFDFLTGAEIYKSYWTQCTKDNIQITMAKMGFWGSCLVKLFQIIIKVGNIRRLGLRQYYYKRKEARYQQRGARMIKTSMSTTQK